MFRNDFSGPFQRKLIAHALNGKPGASEYGGHIILSDDILTELLTREIQYPMLFKLQVDGTKRSVYCGVTEFTAPQGTVFLPDWIMTQLDIRAGQEVSLFNVILQLGTYLLIRPHTYKFVETYSDPKTILEQHIVKYPTLTKGTVIKINVDGQVWSFDIVDLKPARAVCILNTDLRLDFDQPRDIADYEAKMKEEAEQRKINRQFAETASEFQTTPGALSPVLPAGHLDSPHYESHTPVDFNHGGNQSAVGADNGVNVFAQNSDEEEGNIPLASRFGGGNSIKRDGGSRHPSAPVSPKPTVQSANTKNGTIFAPRTTTLATTTSTTTTTTTTTTTGPSISGDSEAERKKQRAELARQQRAALFGKAVGKPITTATPGPTDALKNDKKTADILGTNKELQGVVALAPAGGSESAESKARIVREGDWFLHYDDKGRLIKREDAKNSFSTSVSRGVGNSIKKD